MIYGVKKRIRELSHDSHAFTSLYLFANRCKTRLFSGMPDEIFAKMKYRENTGKKLDLKNPTTYNEKLWWLKLNNRDPLLTICSDKYRVREYVENAGLSQILTRLYGVYDNADEIDFAELPDRVFLKTNHGCGMNAIFDRSKPFDIESFKLKFNSALKHNYFLQSREWNYKNIEPKIIAEEELVDKENGSLPDYKFMCFDGKVRLVIVYVGTSRPDGSHSPRPKRNAYDTDFNPLDIHFGPDQFDPVLVKKPQNFEKMIDYAEILSEPFPHCRVDLYNIGGRVYFGEITFYHGGATQSITPREWQERVGSWIDLRSNKIVTLGCSRKK